jgi:hypothetical protein
MSKRYNDPVPFWIKELGSLDRETLDALEEECRKRGDIHKLALLETERLRRRDAVLKRRHEEGRRRLAVVGIRSGVFDHERLEMEARIRLRQAKLKAAARKKAASLTGQMRVEPLQVQPPTARRRTGAAVWWFGMFGGLALLVTALSTFAYQDARAREKRWRKQNASFESRRAELSRLRKKQKELTRLTAARLARLTEQSRAVLSKKRITGGVGRVAAQPKKSKNTARKRKHRTKKTHHNRRTTTTRAPTGLGCSPDDPLCGT